MEDKKIMKDKELEKVTGGADSDYEVHLYTPHHDDGVTDGLVHFGYKGQWNKIKTEFCPKCNADVLVEVTTDYATHREMHRCSRNLAHIWYVDI